MSSAVVNPSQFSQSPARRQPIMPSSLFGTLIFVVTEIMFFMALISAVIIIRGNNPGFSVPRGIVLPVATTAVNTAVLFFSGFLLYRCGAAMRRKASKQEVELLLLASMIAGAVFVGVQGFEWIHLLEFGLTMSSSVFGAVFFLVIGTHGLHAIAAILAMAYIWRKAKSGTMRLDHIYSLQAFWFFVVGIWPILYGLVYF